MIRFLECVHKYLQKYCVIEIVMICLCFLFNADLINTYFANLERLKEWDVAAVVSFHAASVGIIKLCLESINIDQGGKDER